MRKEKKTTIDINDIYELLQKEIDSYNINEVGALEKRMTLIKFKKILEKLVDETK